MSCPNTPLKRPFPTSFRLRGLAFRLLTLSVLALACASPSPSGDPGYDVLHEGFGVRADLDGWRVYRDAESAPAMLRSAFGNKQGPDDPPLFVAMRDGAIFTAIVNRSGDVDALGFFERLESGLTQHGEITRANRLTGSDDILFEFRVGPSGLVVHSLALVHAAEGRVVYMTLTSPGKAGMAVEFNRLVLGFVPYFLPCKELCPQI